MEVRSTAPGTLEQVRMFLNTWRIPNDTREITDLLPDVLTAQQDWTEGLPPPADLTELAELRGWLREQLGVAQPDGLADWLDRHPVLARPGSGDQSPVVHAPQGTGTGDWLLAFVIDALDRGHWLRLKACPDCQWVFFDHSRNGSRTWCGMYAGGPHGRACGSIAKVRAYRARQASTPPTP